MIARTRKAPKPMPEIAKLIELPSVISSDFVMDIHGAPLPEIEVAEIKPDPFPALRILVVCIHYPVASGRYIVDALRRLGQDVRHIGDSTGNNIWGIQVDPRWAWNSDGGWTIYWPDWKPDLIILADSAFAYHHPVYADVPHIVWGVDNHVRDYRQSGLQHLFLAHKEVSIIPWLADMIDNREGLRADMDMTWLPCAYDPVWHTPSTIPFWNREYDCALVGVMYLERVRLVEALRTAGFRVFAATGALFEDYRKAYHNARISLCLSVKGDLSQRVFETAAMGCAIVTDAIPDLAAHNDELRLKGMMIAASEEEMISHVRELLNKEPIDVNTTRLFNEPPIMEIAGGMGLGEFAAQKIQESVIGKHTWDERAKVVLKWWEGRYGNR